MSRSGGGYVPDMKKVTASKAAYRNPTERKGEARQEIDEPDNAKSLS
jgi:hypothetical protein